MVSSHLLEFDKSSTFETMSVMKWALVIGDWKQSFIKSETDS
jgi:hypothetical protein